VNPISIAVVGCGYWGPNLIRNFFDHDAARLSTICDLDQQKMAKMGKRYPDVRLTIDYQTLLDDSTLDAIAIATPVHTHYQLAQEALKAGKHVLVEKPMCLTSDQCLELIALAEEHQRVLMVDHTFIYHSAVQYIKSELEQEALGDILYFDSVRINLGLFQTDVNVIWDLATHDLSILDYLLGKTPKTIHASGCCHTDNGFEDIAYLTLNYDENVIAHCHLNWLSPVKIRKILIGGTKKMIVYDDIEPTEKVHIYDKGISVLPVESDEKRYQKLIQYRLGDKYVPAIENREALETCVAHFIDCIQHQKIPLTDGSFGLRIVKLLEAANYSLKSGQPIELAQINAL